MAKETQVSHMTIFCWGIPLATVKLFSYFDWLRGSVRISIKGEGGSSRVQRYNNNYKEQNFLMKNYSCNFFNSSWTFAAIGVSGLSSASFTNTGMALSIWSFLI